MIAYADAALVLVRGGTRREVEPGTGEAVDVVLLKEAVASHKQMQADSYRGRGRWQDKRVETV